MKKFPQNPWKGVPFKEFMKNSLNELLEKSHKKFKKNYLKEF